MVWITRTIDFEYRESLMKGLEPDMSIVGFFNTLATDLTEAIEKKDWRVADIMLNAIQTDMQRAFAMAANIHTLKAMQAPIYEIWDSLERDIPRDDKDCLNGLEPKRVEKTYELQSVLHMLEIAIKLKMHERPRAEETGEFIELLKEKHPYMYDMMKFMGAQPNRLVEEREVNKHFIGDDKGQKDNILQKLGNSAFILEHLGFIKRSRWGSKGYEMLSDAAYEYFNPNAPSLQAVPETP